MIRDIFKTHSLELLEDLPVGVFMVNADGQIRHWNREAVRLWGREPSSGEYYTASPVLLDMHRRPIPREQLPLVRALRDGKSSTGLELIIRRLDSSEVYVSANISTMQDGHGNLAGAVVCFQDVTDRQLQAIERTDLIRELNQRAEELAQANSAKDQFLAALSHELRTPLAPVLMTAQMLQSTPGISPEMREDLEMISRNVELEARLIDDLLDVTRIARGKLELRAEAVDGHALLRESADTCCQSDFNVKKQNVRFELNAQNSTVWGDAPRLQQIFWNLLKNAVKFTGEEKRIWIRTRNEQQGDQQRFVLEVEDEGVGIAPETLPHIFNAFEQGSKEVTRKFGGLGLGLAISHALAEMHHGKLTAYSDGPGKGARFKLSIPTIAKAQPRDEKNCPLPTSRALRILLVEDHASTAEVMKRLLKSHDHEVSVAHSVEEALNLASSGDFDLLLSDLGLPDGSGFDLMKTLKERMKGIALSGYGMEDDIDCSERAGFEMHLTKPVDFRKLQSAILQVTGRN